MCDHMYMNTIMFLREQKNYSLSEILSGSHEPTEFNTTEGNQKWLFFLCVYIHDVYV